MYEAPWMLCTSVVHHESRDLAFHCALYKGGVAADLACHLASFQEGGQKAACCTGHMRWAPFLSDALELGGEGNSPCFEIPVTPQAML